MLGMGAVNAMKKAAEQNNRKKRKINNTLSSGSYSALEGEAKTFSEEEVNEALKKIREENKKIQARQRLFFVIGGLIIGTVLVMVFW